jgi:hypothetical protein
MCRWFTARYSAILTLNILVYVVVLSDRIRVAPAIAS